MSRILWAVLAIAVSPIASGETGSPPGEATVAAYEALESYCDEVEALEIGGLRAEYRRCFSRDGRYKVFRIYDNHWKNQAYWWGDSAMSFVWFAHTEGGGLETDHYAEEPRRRAIHGGRPEGLALEALSLFLPEAGDSRDAAVRAFAPFVAADSADGEQVYEHRYTNSLSGTAVVHRLWLRSSDGLVVGAEESWDGKVVRAARLKNSRVNVALAPADLEHQGPVASRYSLATRPRTFVGALCGAAFVIGLLGSLPLARRSAAWQWMRVWKFYVLLAGIAAALLGVLALLSLPGGGHPPPIVFVMILGAFVGIGFLALAALLVGAQLGGGFARRFSSAP